MTQEERIRRAEEAARLIDNPLLKDALNDIREGLVTTIEQCKWGDDVKKTHAMLSLQLLKGLKTILEKHIVDGQVAQKEIRNMGKRRW